ncbi:MAG: hypothetical protein K2N00_04750, partial [Lachnospiraceae bacterium]|nr:hypothetical protein [Lachnospiraceae bacterium]
MWIYERTKLKKTDIDKEKIRKPFNAKLFYRRTFLIVYDIISIILASYMAILLRYDFRMDSVPKYFRQPIDRMLPINIVLTMV